jgi:hypothetical protein
MSMGKFMRMANARQIETVMRHATFIRAWVSHTYLFQERLQQQAVHDLKVWVAWSKAIARDQQLQKPIAKTLARCSGECCAARAASGEAARLTNLLSARRLSSIMSMALGLAHPQPI